MLLQQKDITTNHVANHTQEKDKQEAADRGPDETPEYEKAEEEAFHQLYAYIRNDLLPHPHVLTERSRITA